MDYLTYILPSQTEFRVGWDASTDEISFNVHNGMEWEGYRIPVLDALAVAKHLTRAAKAALNVGGGNDHVES